MIYVATIQVPDHQKWGAVHQVETILPSQVRRVTAFWANATLPPTSVPAVCVAADKESLRQAAFAPRSVQIGSISATLNNTRVVADSAPLRVLGAADKGTLSLVRTILPDGGIEVENGSALRIIIEEKLAEPFERDTQRLILAGQYDALDYGGADEDGTPANISTNGYAAKFYIEYDK